MMFTEMQMPGGGSLIDGGRITSSILTNLKCQLAVDVMMSSSHLGLQI